MGSSPPPRRVFRLEEAADYCGFSRSEIYRMIDPAVRDRESVKFPLPFRFDERARPRWDVRDLDEWVDAKKAEDLARNERHGLSPEVKARCRELVRGS